MVVQIDPIANQVVALKMMELTTRFPQLFATTTMKGKFHFLTLRHITNSKETYGITWPREPHHFRLGVSRIFNN